MRRGGQPQQTTPVKILGDHAERIKKLDFRTPSRRYIRYDYANVGDYLIIDAVGVNGDVGTSPLFRVGNVYSSWAVGINGQGPAGFGSTGAAGNDGYTWITSTDVVDISADGAIDMEAGGGWDAEITGLTVFNLEDFRLRVHAMETFLAGNAVTHMSTGNLYTFYNHSLHALFTLDETGQLTVDIGGDESHSVAGQFQVDASDITLDGPTTIESGTLEVKLPLGETLTVFDHLNNPIFRVNENGDLQGKTGKALVFTL